MGAEVLDHRGRPTSLYQVRGAMALSDRAVPEALARKLRASERPYNAVLLIAATVTAVCGFIAAGWIGIPEVWAHLIVWPCVLVAVFLVLLRWPPVRTTQRTVQILLEAGRCASCTYGLGGVPPEHDGCTVCPECGAAWRVA